MGKSPFMCSNFQNKTFLLYINRGPQMISILTSLVLNYYVKKMEYYRFNFHKTNPISIKVELYKNGGQNLVNLCKKKKNAEINYYMVTFGHPLYL